MTSARPETEPIAEAAEQAVPRSKTELGILVAVGLISVGWIAYVTRLYLMDDTLITLRYSLNFVRYGHPVWNHADLARPGLGYGYTSILWMIINVFPALITQNKDVLVQMSRVLSLVPLVVIILMIASRAGRMPGPLIVRVLAVFAIFSASLYGFHVNTGMETLLFSCFVLLSVVTHSHSQKPGLPYLFATLAFLTRPEGALLIPVLCIADLAARKYRRAAIGVAAFVATALVVGLVMQLEYGHFLSNSFYVKQVHGIVAKSVAKTGTFIMQVALPFIPLALISVYRIKDATSRLCWYTALIFLAYFTTVEDIMNITFRFQMPVIVLLTHASLPAIEGMVKDWKRWRLAGAALFIVAMACNYVGLKKATWWSALYGTDISSYTAIGKAMKAYQTDGRWLMFDWAGAIPYYSDWDTCDVFGLTDYNLASHRLTASDVMKDPKTELVFVYRQFFMPFPVQDTEQKLANLQFLVSTDKRSIALRDYTIAGNIPVMIDDNTSFGVLRVFSRHPETTKAMFSGVRLKPRRPTDWLSP